MIEEVANPDLFANDSENDDEFADEDDEFNDEDEEFDEEFDEDVEDIYDDALSEFESLNNEGGEF